MRTFQFFSLSLFAILVGCGGDDATSNTTTDTGTSTTDTDTSTTDTGTSTTDTGTSTTDTGTSTTDTGTTMTDSSSTETGDTGPMLVNGCADADFIDATTDASKRKIDMWSTATGKRCVKIKKGQSFTWTPSGGFSVHPLEAFGGDTPNPIPLTNTGTTKTVDFPNEGTFGYHCANHPVMLGAIRVVP